MANKLIVLMVDGVSAEHYALDHGRFPHFAALEKHGFRVERLKSEVLGTSLPGRTSMLTGATADISGVYANKIWDGERFRYANPDDVRVPTLPARAKEAGLDVAILGFGMIQPESASLFHAPWWTGAFIQRARDAAPEPAEAAWLRVATHQPGERFAAACAAAGIPSEFPKIDAATPEGRMLYGIVADHMIADWVGAVAASEDAPDLIMAEFLSTDSIQHASGYRHDLSHWITAQADLALGKIMQRLRLAGTLDQWNFAVMSDHGHSAVTQSLHPSVIVPGVRTQCEGGSLLVAPRTPEELAHVTEQLAAYGVEPYPNTCIPPEYREQVFVFVAPDGISFEDDNPNETETTGAPGSPSTHGMKPGMPGDDRYALFMGPNVPTGAIASGTATQVAPTLAALLGLDISHYAAAPLFMTR
ncbi:MAG: alkaline phosphatase family protein [Pleurocapsa minor GSE-CHR-MK-17-07R]|jgi:predicted AlkP superfamily pyrophosphatase or phosphodiesterase|nr:alkaline phosphatase family protein [Pleurocapsa minor GSE-CHR-MK 17-07R]